MRSTTLNLPLRWSRWRWADLAPALRGYFAFHGVWAPGVRLLRRLPMSAKAGVIAAAFSVPLVGLLAVAVPAQLEEVAGIERRLAGLAYADTAFRLAALWHDERIALQSGAGSAPEAAAARAALAGKLTALSSGLGSSPALAELQQAHARAQATVDSAAGQTPAARIGPITTLMQSLVGLHDAAGQATGLAIDHDATTVRLVQVGLRDVPQLGVALGRLRRVGTALADAAAQSPAPGSLHELRYEVVRSAVMLERALTDLEQQFGHDLPGLAGTLKAELQLTSRRALDLVNERLVTETVTVGPEELSRALEAAVAAGRPLRAAAVEAVQQRLTQRLATVERRALVLGELLVVALSAGAYMLLAFLRVTSGGLEVIHRQVMRLADGDLSARPEPLGRDEVAAALSGLSQSLNKLSDLMASVRQGVSAMNHATQEIARGNGALSTRNERSTATIAQIVQRVNDYSGQLEQTAALVAETAHAVDALRLDAMRSHKHMDKLRERVQALQVNGRRIGEIAALMDGIAFRTNVLALNASIQASKAGEAGRGFAVVAQEVRALAMRSADSARSIHEIVAGSGEDIAQAYELATVTDKSLDDTYAHVEQIHGVMSQVVTMTQGGQKAMEALVGDVQQLDASTRDNHRLVEQLAAASDALRRQGERLARKVSSFRLR